MSLDRQTKMLALAALLISALALSGCATSIADMPLAGTPADAPPRPKDNSPWLPVNDLPPDREAAALDPIQRAKIQAELIAARDHQAAVTAKDATSTAAKDSAITNGSATKDSATGNGPATAATDTGAK
jgi:PBP1b-binding outer membrane lipoprotein LpoB